MNFWKNLTKFEVLTYLVVLTVLIFMYVISRVVPERSNALITLFAPSGQIATMLAIGVPALIFTSTMIAFCLREPSHLALRIAPPVRLVSDSAISKLSFLLFWCGVIGLGAVRILIVPQLG